MSDLIPVNQQEMIDILTASKDYFYSYTKGGKLVEGLTIEGINECANRMNFEIIDLKHFNNDHSYFAIAKAKDPYTNSTRWGAFEQPKVQNGKTDPHAFTKAIHKAQRNALKQLIPHYVQKAVIAIAKGGKPPPPPQEKQTAEKTDRMQKATFAEANKLYDKFAEKEITKETFWNFIKAAFKVESRNDMTIQDWTELHAKLQASNESTNVLNELTENINTWKTKTSQKQSKS